MNKLTDKTWIPLGVAIVVIGGGAAWATNVQQAVSKVKDISIEIYEMKMVLVEVKTELKALRDDLKENIKRRGNNNAD